MFWLLGRFHPAPAFEKHRLVFETLEALWMKEDGDEAGDLLEQINGWGLTVEDEEGRVRGVTDFKINQGKFEHKLI